MDAVDPKIVAHAEDLWRASHESEPLLRFLRDRGLSKIDSIKIIRSICRISLGDAKRIVSYSPVWQDTLESTVALQDEALAALDLTERS
jgi:ribosomal protein L7/L12